MGQSGLIRRCALVTAFALVVAACGSQSSSSQDETDPDTQYTFDSGAQESRARITTPQGEVVLRSGTDIFVDLPAGFAIYPGARILRSTATDFQSKRDRMVTMRSADRPEMVLNFYRAHALNEGFTIDMDLAAADHHALDGGRMDGIRFSVSVLEEEGGAFVTLRITDRGLG